MFMVFCCTKIGKQVFENVYIVICGDEFVNVKV